MATAKPFTWVVSFTVAPLWVQDGFSISDERATEMLGQALQSAHSSEYSAKVLNAPRPLQIVKMQGYAPHGLRAMPVIADLREGSPSTGVVSDALVKARDLLDSVAFVAQPGDTDKVLQKLNEALALIDARQGEPEEVEA